VNPSYICEFCLSKLERLIGGRFTTQQTSPLAACDCGRTGAVVIDLDEQADKLGQADVAMVFRVTVCAETCEREECRSLGCEKERRAQ
jgi:hypothetical protein